MTLILDLSIVCDQPRGRYVYATVRKELKTDLVPMIGMHLEDGAWKEFPLRDSPHALDALRACAP